MFSYINNLIHLPALLIQIAKDIQTQKQFIERTLAVDIEKSKQTNDNTLDEQDFRKITQYYGLAVPAILGEAFCRLRGSKMSEKERLATTYLGALTGLFDDFFDKKDSSEKHILELVTNPKEANCKNENEKLIVYFYQKALENCKHPVAVQQAALKVFDAQKQSKKQKISHISFDEIKQITSYKGGTSLQFYRSAFGEITDETEKELLYRLGGLGQLENDLFDVFKDNKDNIGTLVTTAVSIKRLEEIYISEYNEVLNLISKTKYKEKNKQRFQKMVSLVFSRGLVCLNQLKKTEKTTNNRFVPAAYTCQQLICDMEKPCNVLRSMHYFANWNKTSNKKLIQL